MRTLVTDSGKETQPTNFSICFAFFGPESSLKSIKRPGLSLNSFQLLHTMLTQTTLSLRLRWDRIPCIASLSIPAHPSRLIDTVDSSAERNSVAIFVSRRACKILQRYGNSINNVSHNQTFETAPLNVGKVSLDLGSCSSAEAAGAAAATFQFEIIRTGRNSALLAGVLPLRGCRRGHGPDQCQEG